MQELSQVIRSPDMSEADQLTKLRSLLAPHCCKRPGREVGRTHTVQREVSEEGHEGGGVGSWTGAGSRGLLPPGPCNPWALDPRPPGPPGVWTLHSLNLKPVGPCNTWTLNSRE